jgi:predicted component of type VI protein secretion system
MTLESVLTEYKPSVVKKWIEVVIQTYPADARRFLRKEKDRFSNPVGNTITEQMEALYDQLVKEGEAEKIASSLDTIIRIRAVQDFKPSQAVAFVLQLKQVVRDTLEDKAPQSEFSGELQMLEKKIDETVLMAFDIYSKCRRHIQELKVEEYKRQVSRLLKRANLVCEIQELEPHL